MARGTLRLYLGAAPGVGKTFAMLGEGRRRSGRGTDVVVGLVETHGGVRTAEQLGDLEVVPRQELEYRGAAFTEMDTDAILARRPQVVLIDELAHTNVPGGRHAKRWEDVEEILDAGIDVISTLNIQHLESLNDVVERVTGVVQRETIPDEIVRGADQIELVDMTPEALRRRMAHGNIYAPEKVDAALGHYFRVGNLGALRELALLWMADRVDDELSAYRDRYGISEPWETKERIVVALTAAPGRTDAHVTPPPQGDKPPMPTAPRRGHRVRFPPRRRLAGWLLAALAVPALTAGLTPFRDSLGLPGVLLVLLLGVVGVTLVGGAGPALLAAAAAALLADFYFTPPYNSFHMRHLTDAVALAAFVAVAATVSVLFDRLGRRARPMAQLLRDLDARALLVHHR